MKVIINQILHPVKQQERIYNIFYHWEVTLLIENLSQSLRLIELVKSFLQTMQIIVMQVYQAFILSKQIEHLVTTKPCCTQKIRQCFLSYVLFYHQTTPKIDKDMLFESLAVHDIVWLDVSMDDFQDMHRPQTFFDLYSVSWCDFTIVANLRWEFNALRSDDDIESHDFVYFRSDLKLGEKKQEKVLP